MSSLSEPSWGLLFSSVLFRSDLVERKELIDSFEEKWRKSHLATGKNFVHRIYLDKGVFSDLNLTFKGKSFIPLPWTYPDYKNLEVIEIFNWMRTYLLIQLN